MRNESKKTKRDTPLAKWMGQRGLNASEVAKMLTAHRGVVTYYSSVCSWKTGARAPSDAAIIAIEAVSLGDVKRDSWPCWRQRSRKRSGCVRASEVRQ